MRKKCKICGKGFYTKNRGNRAKYCSKKCAKIANRNKSKKRMRLGTNSQSLSRKSVKKQLDFIRRYKNSYIRPSNDSQHDICSKKQVYYPVEDDDGFIDENGGFDG